MEIDGQVIVLIIFVVISGIQWFIKKVQGKDDPSDNSESLENIYDDFREEIRQRQTTLQQPETAQVPPPLAVSGQAHAPTNHTEVISFQAPAPPRFSMPEPAVTLTTAQREAVAKFEERGRIKTRHSAPPPSISARSLLTNPQSARQAVILQEIFSKPRSLQKF